MCVYKVYSTCVRFLGEYVCMLYLLSRVIICICVYVYPFDFCVDIVGIGLFTSAGCQ